MLKSANKSNWYLLYFLYIFCLPVSIVGQTDSSSTEQNKITKENWKIDKEIIAVLNFSVTGIEKLAAEVLTNQFAIEINKTANYVVYDRVGMKEITSQKGVNLDDCNDSKCFSELGRLLDVSTVVIGSIEKLDEFEYINGSPFNISVSMLDVSGDSTLASRKKIFSGNAEVLMMEIQILAWELLGEEVPISLIKKRSGGMATKDLSNKTLMGAVLRSAVVPGLGQIYMGNEALGYLWMGSSITFGVIAASSYNEFRRGRNESESIYDDYMASKVPTLVRELRLLSKQADNDLDRVAREAELMVSVGLGLWFANVVHTHMNARKADLQTSSRQKPFIDFVYDYKLKQPQLRLSFAFD